MWEYFKRIRRAMAAQKHFQYEHNTDTWLKGDAHYHCKKCGGNIRFLSRVHWNMIHGVRAFGVCRECSFLFIESEYSKNIYIRIK